MLKKIYISIIFFVVLAISCSADVLYDYKYLQSLKGGYGDTILAYTAQEHLPLNIFRALLEKRPEDISPYDLKIINRIREKQIEPDSDTLMQKIILTSEIDKYISGEYRAPKGFVSICADVKHYKTIADLYHGLRLDYIGSGFKIDDRSYGVIRFKAFNITSAFVPKSKFAGGDISSHHEFGRLGFTAGNNDRLGSPEWFFPDFVIMDDGAQIFEIFSDGSEKLRAVYCIKEDRFIDAEK